MTEPNPDNPTLKIEAELEDGEIVTVVLEFHFSDNAEEHMNVSQFVNNVASTLLG